MSDSSWLTVDQAASRMGFCRRTVYGYITAGKLRAIQVGRTLRIEPSAIDEFKRIYTVQTAPRSQPSPRPVLVASRAASLGGDRYR